MNRAKIKKASYVIANAFGKLTRVTAITSLGCFMVGFAFSLILDECERRDIRDSFKSIKK